MQYSKEVLSVVAIMCVNQDWELEILSDADRTIYTTPNKLEFEFGVFGRVREW